MANEAPQSGTQQSAPTEEGEQGSQAQDPVQTEATQDPSASSPGGDDGGTGQGVEEGGEDSRSIDSLPKWAQKHIKELRDESAKYRTRAKEQEEAQRKAQLTEEERIREEAAEQARQEERTKANERLLSVQVRAKLAENGIVNPEKSARLLDHDNLSVDDDGEVTGLDEAVEQLKTEFPNLVQRPNTQPNIGNREAPAAPPSMNDLIRRRAGIQ